MMSFVIVAMLLLYLFVSPRACLLDRWDDLPSPRTPTHARTRVRRNRTEGVFPLA